ncbi:unnamed protein product [Umbelopsis vinacea]
MLAPNPPPLTTYLVENPIISDDDFESFPKYRTVTVGSLTEQRRIAKQIRRRVVESSSNESDSRLSPLRESSTTQARLQAIADLPADPLIPDEDYEYEYDISDLPKLPVHVSVTKPSHAASSVRLPVSNVSKHAQSPVLLPTSNVSKHTQSPMLLPTSNVSKHASSPGSLPDNNSFGKPNSKASSPKHKNKASDGLTSKIGSFMSNLMPGNRSAPPKPAVSPDSDKRSVVRIVARSGNTTKPIPKHKPLQLCNKKI